ncbi:hypothetical protein CPB84DRAFT_1624965, partial [Gymnopilus junonius]
TVDQVSCIFTLLWCLQPARTNKLHQVYVYHSICPPEYNKETIQHLDTDPDLQIVIATVAFSNGLNAKSFLHSLFFGFGITFNESWQEKGCVGR